MATEHTRKIIIHVRTVFENGMGLVDQNWYNDKMTLTPDPDTPMNCADEDWYEGIVYCGNEKTIIELSGKDIPPDFDDKKGHHMEIKVYEIGIDDIDINSVYKDVELIDDSFNFQYEASELL